MMALGLNRLHWPVTALGPGRRVGIWLQGCSIGCPGCVSRDTWAPAEDGDRIPVADVVATVDRLVGDGADGPVDGVTVTGGEPFEQPEALAALLAALREWLDVAAEGSDRADGADLLVYTGFGADEAEARGPEAFARADAVIAGPYVAGAGEGDALRGSANQRLVCATPAVERRYAAHLEQASPTIQTAVKGGQIHMIGIPSRRALSQVERRLQAAGIELGAVSWRP